ncbi:MAG: methyltransferase domain-containing protein [Chitinophagaceae bacterium]|nr:methyltransferase domain-containing protein [Chitinophagaceae bacterium]
MKEKYHYTNEFYSGQEEGSYTSAQEILKYVNEVFHPNSVVDIGCGVGYWLKVWKEEFGITDIFGVEGPYVSKSLLKIPEEFVLFKDLKQPFELNRKFDLAMSLEVAEHLPETSADDFVRSITHLSDVILFSAAIVGQEGTYHINEQLPEYWARKFENLGYTTVDYLRPKIWVNEKIEWWYRQNVLIYINKEKLKNYPALIDSYKSTSVSNLFRVQPWLYFHKLEYIEKTKTVSGYIRWKLYPLKKYFKKIFSK